LTDNIRRNHFSSGTVCAKHIYSK